MKRILLFLFSFIVIFCSWAQGQSLKWGFEAGTNISLPTDFDCTRVGYSVGGFAEMQRGEDLFVIFGLRLGSKPVQFSRSYYDSSSSVCTSYGAKATPYYLTLPVNFGYRWKLDKNCVLNLGAGPYASLGLFGKGNHIICEQVQPGKFNFFDSYRRFDWGVDIISYIEIAEHYRFSLGFQKGLYNLQKYAPAIKHNVLNVNIGYRF